MSSRPAFRPPQRFPARTRHLSLSCDPQHLAFSPQGSWHRFIRLPPYQFISYYLPLRSTSWSQSVIVPDSTGFFTISLIELSCCCFLKTSTPNVFPAGCRPNKTLNMAFWEEE
ncbi:uncharacterized [Tachysurus ichikawai]